MFKTLKKVELISFCHFLAPPPPSKKNCMYLAMHRNVHVPLPTFMFPIPIILFGRLK